MNKCLLLISIITISIFYTVQTFASSAPIITTNGKIAQGIDQENNVVHLKKAELKVGVATTEVSDTDGGDIDFRITDAYDGHLFSMLNGKIRFIHAPQYDTPLDVQGNNAYNLQLLAIDSEGNKTYQRIRVVIERNQAPIIETFGVESQGENYTENIAIIDKSELDSLFVVTPEISDPEKDDTSSPKILDFIDGDLFQITDNSLYFKNVPDRNNSLSSNGNNVYNVLIEVEDVHGNTSQQQIKVVLQQKNEEQIKEDARRNYKLVDEIHEDLLAQDSCPTDWRNKSFQDRLKLGFQANYYDESQYRDNIILPGQNKSLYLHAHSLLAGSGDENGQHHDISMSEFIAKTQEEVEDRFYRYLYDGTELDSLRNRSNISLEEIEDIRDDEIFIVIDIEHHLAPGKLGFYDYSDDTLRAYAKAYDLRVRVVRSYFPNAKISAYGSLIFGGNIFNSERLEASQKMKRSVELANLIAEYGAFDSLDYISPVFYIRRGLEHFGGREDRFLSHTKDYMNFLTSESLKMEKSNSKGLCIAPVIGTVYGVTTKGDYIEHIPEDILTNYWQSYMNEHIGGTYLGPILYWGERSLEYYAGKYPLQDIDGNPILVNGNPVGADYQLAVSHLNNGIDYIIPNRSPYITTTAIESQGILSETNIVPITVTSGDTFITSTRIEAIYGNTLSSFSVKESTINVENFVFDGTTLSFKNPIIHTEDNTYGNKYDVTLEAIDNEGNKTEQVIRVYVGRSNAPTISTFSPSLIRSQGIQNPIHVVNMSVPTGNKSIGSALAKSKDGEITPVKIINSYDSELIEIQNGHISFKQAPDINNPRDITGNNAYNFIIEAQDTQGNTSQQRIRVQITEDTRRGIRVELAKTNFEKVEDLHTTLKNQDNCPANWQGQSFQERNQVAFQGKYYDDSIAVGVQNEAIFIQGYSLLVGMSYSFDEFILADKESVMRRFSEYVSEDAMIHHMRNEDFLILLDLEGPAHPSHIKTRLGLNNQEIQKYAEAYNMRVEVVRSFFPKAKISNYGAPIMNATSARKSDPYSYSYVVDVIDGLQTAAGYGAFDGLDYLAPNMYVRNSPNDLRKALKQQTITREEYLVYMEKYFNLSTEIALSITKSNGNSHCLAPTFLNIYVQGKDSPDYNIPVRNDFLRDYTQKYMDTYKDSPNMGPIIYWGRKSIEDYSAGFNGTNITEQMQYLNSNID